MGRVSWREYKAQIYASPDTFTSHLSPGRFIYFLRKSDFDSLLYVKILIYATSSNDLLTIFRASTTILSCILVTIRRHTSTYTYFYLSLLSDLVVRTVFHPRHTLICQGHMTAHHKISPHETEVRKCTWS